ncbi:hypothetical protein NQ315_015359 [Exocentrus adspersus]|uniref:Tyr recombinase domain-containing protein n=1 Tax=Exocentrus adspersus TaxID=1586481 RepID=A0AAV8VKE8_9CUCU|nr:hypothetical protein NQ315_015359 [Exocentrus adspersus]
MTIDDIEDHEKSLTVKVPNTETNVSKMENVVHRWWEEVLSEWSAKIATFLGLQDPKNFTGHAFRRTSATLLANTGVDILGLKRHGGWKSSTVAEGYVEDFLHNKTEFAEKILHNADGASTSATRAAESVSLKTKALDTRGITISNCTNCTFIFNMPIT